MAHSDERESEARFLQKGCTGWGRWAYDNNNNNSKKKKCAGFQVMRGRE